jgi:hypothetical protein
MTHRIKHFTLRNAVAFTALFVCLGGTATAAKLIGGGDIKDGSIERRDIARDAITSSRLRNDGVLSKDIRNGTIRAEDLSATVRAELGDGSGAAGAKGETGPAGPKGDTGAKGDAGTAATPGASGGMLVKDADGALAGQLLTFSTVESSSPTITFFHSGRAFIANAATGALALPLVDFYYAEPDCGGAPYHSLSYPQQTAVRSEQHPGSVYAFSSATPSPVAVQSYWSRGFYGDPSSCMNGSFTQAMVAMEPVPGDDTPPPLNGPLTYAPAG